MCVTVLLYCIVNRDNFNRHKFSVDKYRIVKKLYTALFSDDFCHSVPLIKASKVLTGYPCGPGSGRFDLVVK